MDSYNLLTDTVSSLWDQGVGILTSVSNRLLLKYQQDLLFTTAADTGGDRKRLAVTTVTVVFGSYVLWKVVFSKRTRGSTTVKRVSGGLPYFGHMFELSRDPVAFINRCKAEQGHAFRICVDGQDLHVLAGPLIQEMLRQPRYFNFEEGIQAILPVNRVIRLSYDHKFKGEQLGRRDKSPITYPIKQNFKADQISVFTDRIQHGVNKVLGEKLNLKPGEKRVLPAWDILSITVSQVSCLCLAGSKVGHNQDLVESMANFTQKVTRAGITLALLPEWIANFLIKRYLSVENQIDLTMDLLVPEMEKIRVGEINHDEPSYAAMVLNLPKANGQLRTPQEAAFYFKNIVLASIHTTTTFASFALHELACRPALQAELRTEIEKLREDDRTPETVSQIRLLDSLLREVLRYDTSYLGMHHMTLDNVTLSTGQMIPRGSLVLGAMYDAHIHPAYMPETAALGSSSPLDQFDAHRFMHASDDDNTSASSVGPEYMTFGMFAHACPGRYFAVNEIKYILAELIMRYDITTESGERAKDFVLRGMTRFPPRDPLVFTGRSSTTSKVTRAE